MNLQVDMWQFIGLQGALIAALGGLLLKVGHVLLGQFLRQFERRLDDRFAAQDKTTSEAKEHWEARFNDLERGQRVLERQQNAIREEMLRDYTRREDTIRDQTVTQAKLDALGAKIELISQMLIRRELS